MKKLSIIIILILALTAFNGCAKRTASDLSSADLTAAESNTLESVDTDETKKDKKDTKKSDETKKSNETKKTESTKKEEDKTDKQEETKGKEVTPEPSIDTPIPSGNGSSSGGNSSGGSSSGGNSSGGSSSGGNSSGGSSSGGSSSGGSSTNPEDPKPQSDPTLPATVKVYSLNGVNVAVVNVKNEKGKDCSVEVKGTYKRADGSVIRTEAKTFSGLSAGDDNNFIFNPEIAFASFTCETKEVSDGAPAYSGLITFETKGEMHNAADEFLSAGGGYYSSEDVEQYNLLAGSVRYKYSGSKKLWYKVDWLVFDNTGKAVNVGTSKGAISTANGIITCTTDIKCEKEEGSVYHIIPDNFKGELNFITSITYLSEDSFM